MHVNTQPAGMSKSTGRRAKTMKIGIGALGRPKALQLGRPKRRTLNAKKAYFARRALEQVGAHFVQLVRSKFIAQTLS
jgi:hypothetical protein